MTPFLKGLTLLLLGGGNVVAPAAADPWVPWRHLVKRYPLAYDPQLLEHGLPTRHVHHRHVPAGARARPRLPPCTSRRVFIFIALAGLGLRRSSGLARRVLRGPHSCARSRLCAPIERYRKHAPVPLRRTP